MRLDLCLLLGFCLLDSCLLDFCLLFVFCPLLDFCQEQELLMTAGESLYVEVIGVRDPGEEGEPIHLFGMYGIYSL